MSLRKDYPYNEALDDLENILKKYVKHKEELKGFLDLIEDARSRKTVPMRGIYQDFVEYTEKYELYSQCSKSEDEVIEELMHFWA